ncbi:unnamed protein product [Clavelina lepadiformis]|uniref:dolichol kinase n=1 Tax=Clavelina lepadiformis TaxID=159417 RepID=A0ABP0H2L6_CLALP
MENALVTSAILITISRKSSLLYLDVIFITICIFCCILQVLPADFPKKWTKRFRPGSQFVFQYGCVVYPMVLSLSSFTLDDVMNSIICSLISLCFVIVISNFNIVLKLVLKLFVVGLTTYCIFNTNILYSQLIFKICAFCIFFAICFYAIPGSFTLGEGILVCQMLTSIYDYELVLFMTSAVNIVAVSMSLANTVLFFVTFSILFFLLLPSLSKESIFYSVGFLFIITAVYNHWLAMIVLEALKFMMQKSFHRFSLLLYWASLVCASVGFVSQRHSLDSASTSERKVFHIFILLVYIPGLICDTPLLYLCSVIACSLFGLLGVIHAFRIKPLGEVLDKSLRLFTSKQDTGTFILTPIYLLLGLSYPVWLCCMKYPSLLENTTKAIPKEGYSGILSVGVGDAVASVVGSKYGAIRFTGSGKTVEGTISSMLVQFLIVLGIHYVNFININSIVSIIFAICLTSLAEAYTDQIDNLVLPLLMYLLLT